MFMCKFKVDGRGQFGRCLWTEVDGLSLEGGFPVKHDSRMKQAVRRESVAKVKGKEMGQSCDEHEGYTNNLFHLKATFSKHPGRSDLTGFVLFALRAPCQIVQTGQKPR